MEKLFNVIKKTKSFNDYFNLIERNNPGFTANSYVLHDTYESDPKMAMLESSTIEVGEDFINIYLHNHIGNIKTSAKKFLGEYHGYAIYEVYVMKEDNDLLLHGSTYAEFTDFNDEMLYENGKNKTVSEVLLNEHFNEKIYGKANAYSSLTKKLNKSK